VWFCDLVNLKGIGEDEALLVWNYGHTPKGQLRSAVLFAVSLAQRGARLTGPLSVRKPAKFVDRLYHLLSDFKCGSPHPGPLIIASGCQSRRRSLETVVSP
jgi:hypothetical protein